MQKAPQSSGGLRSSGFLKSSDGLEGLIRFAGSIELGWARKLEDVGEAQNNSRDHCVTQRGFKIYVLNRINLETTARIRQSLEPRAPKLGQAQKLGRA